MKRFRKLAALLGAAAFVLLLLNAGELSAASGKRAAFQDAPLSAANASTGEQTAGEEASQSGQEPESAQAMPPADSPAGVIEGSGKEPSAVADATGEENREPVVPAAEDFTRLEPAQLTTLGALASDGAFRYLVTLSTKGGSIVRVELNARDRKRNYVYRDLEHFGGYLGHLELMKSPAGLIVGVVGPATPADLAGLKGGDVITKFNGTPVTSIDDFVDDMRKTRAGETVELTFLRGNETLTGRAELTDQPLEMINHEINFVEPGIFSPTSFLCQIFGKTENPSWQAIDREMMTGNWQVASETDASGETVEFRYELSQEKMAAVNLPGPLTVVKRFYLPRLTESEVLDVYSRTFHIGFDLAIENHSTEPINNLGVQIDGPTGATTEGWWYQNKLHGRSTAIFYTAGARDIVTSTRGNYFRFDSGREIITESLKRSPEIYYTIAPPRDNTANPALSQLNFVGVDTQYFNISMLPAKADEDSGSPYSCYSCIGRVASSEIPKPKYLYRKVDVTFMLYERVNVPAEGTYRQRFEIFAGPKQQQLLQQYGMEQTLTYGWFWLFSKILAWVLWLFYNVTLMFSYGLAIIMLTILVRLLVLPISRRAAKNAQMMQLLAPEMKRINEKYKDDFEKRGQATRELYRRHKFNPAGGCGLMMLQLPIFIGLYRALSVDIVLRDQPLIPGMAWCSNLAAPDQLFYWKSWMPSMIADETGWLGPYFNVLPLITIVLFIIQQKMFTPPPTDEQQASMQKIMTYMMVFMGFMFFKVPSGLCIYFITSSIWAIVERQLLPKPQLAEERINEIKTSLGQDLAFESPGKPLEPDPGPEGSTGGGLFGKLRDVVEAAQKKNRTADKPLDAEARRRLDKERRKRLRDR